MNFGAEIRKYVSILWRRKWIILLTTLVALIVSIATTLAATPMYRTSTTLRMATSSTGGGRFADTVYSIRLMNTYAEIITSGPALNAITQTFDLDKKPEVEVNILANTELMEIIVSHQDPVLAASIANFLTEILVEQTKRIKEYRGNPLSVVGPALVPRNPYLPRRTLNIALGLVAGLFGGLGLAFILDNLDTTLYTTKDIETTTELPTLGKIPNINGVPQIILSEDNISSQGEAFRRLRTNIYAFNRQIPHHKTLMVTSARMGEGKSTVVANLSRVFAQSGRTVMVIDGDLRRPTIHKIFGLSNEVGLSNILKQEITPTAAIQESSVPGVWVLPSGPIPASPIDLLESPNMYTLMREVSSQFDLVLLDTPALAAVSDAAVLAPIVDVVVLVVGRAYAKQEEVQAAQEQLMAVNANSVGVVVNRAEQEPSYDYYPSRKITITDNRRTSSTPRKKLSILGNGETSPPDNDNRISIPISKNRQPSSPDKKVPVTDNRRTSTPDWF